MSPRSGPTGHIPSEFYDLLHGLLWYNIEEHNVILLHE